MVIHFHSVFDPVEHDTGKAILIEICDKTLIRLGDAGSLCFFLYDTVQQIVCQMKEICFDLLPVKCKIVQREETEKGGEA